MSKELLYLDDVQVGDTFQSGEYSLTEDEIKNFAKKYDPQSFHTNNELAKESFFKGLSGSGWNTAAITMKLIVESVPFAYGIIGAGVELNWLSPSRPGDILFVKSSVKNIKYSKTKPKQGIIILESETINQHRENRQKTVSKLLNYKN